MKRITAEQFARAYTRINRDLAQARQLASIDETPSKQERKRENQRERAMR